MEYQSDEEQFGEEFIKDTGCELLENGHHLYGYIPDEGYNPHSMEEDGTYPEQLIWTYDNLPEEGLHEDLYTTIVELVCVSDRIFQLGSEEF